MTITRVALLSPFPHAKSSAQQEEDGVLETARADGACRRQRAMIILSPFPARIAGRLYPPSSSHGPPDRRPVTSFALFPFFFFFFPFRHVERPSAFLRRVFFLARALQRQPAAFSFFSSK